MDSSPAAIHARIEQRRNALGITGAEVDRRSDNPHVRKNIAKGSAPSLDKLKQLAEALETTPAWLAFGIAEDDTPTGLMRSPSFPPQRSVPIISKVAAGQWLEVDQAVDAPSHEGVFVPEDPAYHFDHQFAVVVEGTSVNKAAPDGSILGCVDVRAARVQPRDGDLVVVEQTRKGGHEIMRTAKRFHPVPGGVELWPDSDDERWTRPMVIRRDAGDAEGDETTTVIVIGIVTWIHRPLERASGRRSFEPE